MRGSRKDMPVSVDLPEIKLQQVDWDGMTVELGNARKTVDPTPLFKGLPGDRCQCPHWGYVLKGRLRYRYADHEEVYKAGDAYHAPPGHIPVVEAGSEYVEFSPTGTLHKTMEVVEKNMKAV